MRRVKKIKKVSQRSVLLGFIASVLLIVLVFLIVGNLKIANKRKKLGIELEALEKKITELTEENQGLQGKILQSNNSDYLEEVAREELNLKKEGESVVAFPVISESTQEKPEDPEQQSLWQKIMEKIR